MKVNMDLQSVIREYDPCDVVCLFSGGHDSLTVTHWAMAHGARRVAHVDTGIGIPETQRFVVDTCEKYGWPLDIYRASENISAKGEFDPQVYEDIVVKHGFPGPPSHSTMYARLKERAIRRITREAEATKDHPLFFISGVRQQESSRRMGTVSEFQAVGSRQIWLAPFFDLSEDDLKRYMEQHQLQPNPVKLCLGMSGECLCGAFARPGELDRIREHYPETADRIEAIEQKVIAAGHPWGWEDNVPGWYSDKKRADKIGQTDMFQDEYDEAAANFRPLCTGCEAAR